MKKIAIAIVFFLLGIVAVPLAAWFYLNHGNPPVAVADPSFPMEAQIVHIPLNKRIDAEAPKSSPVAINDTTLAAGASVYMKNCEGCHGHPGAPSAFGKAIYPSAPQLWEKHHNGAVVGVSDDPVGETYWKVKNGIRLTAMPTYNSMLSDTEMWEVSNLLSVADKPLSATVQQTLTSPAQ